MKTCPQCQALLDDNAAFCEKCGAKVPFEAMRPRPGGKIICPECGASNPGGGKFCASCGAKLEPPQPSAPANLYKGSAPVPSAETAARGIPEAPYIPPRPLGAAAVVPYYRTSAAANVIRETGKSPVFIIAAAAFCLQFLLNFINSFSSSGNILSILVYLREMGLIDNYTYREIVSELGEVLGLLNTVATGAKFVSYIPGLLTAVGLGLLFAYCVSRNPNTLYKPGFVLINITLIIDLVFICLLFAILDILLIIVFLAGASSGEDVAVFLLMFVLVTAVWVFLILFYANALKSTRYARSAIENSGAGKMGLSVFAAIGCFILAGITVIRLFSNFIFFIAILSSSSAYLLGAVIRTQVILLLTTALSAVSTAMFGVTLLVCRSRIKKIQQGE